MLQECYIAARGFRRFAAMVTVTFAACFSAAYSQVTPTPTPVANPEIHRWLDIDSILLATRIRDVVNANGATADQMQWTFAARGRFKFDAEGRYSVVAGVFTGRTITAGWDNIHFGTVPSEFNVFLKQLYFDAKPGAGVEFQAGGLGINYGESTEATSFDNDTYITGERILIRRPKNLYFNEVSVTNAFYRDISRPDVFYRMRHLGRSNYRQFMVRKQVTRRVAVSADYTFESRRNTMHEAVRVKVPELRVVDSSLFENYQRFSPDRAYGFNVSVDKTIKKRLSITAGFAIIDRRIHLNGDRFPPGDHLYAIAAYKLSREFTIGTFLAHSLGRLPAQTAIRSRYELIFSYNMLETLHRLRVF